MPQPRSSALITIATSGTLGDLWPVLALGSELRRRGHVVRVCAAASLMGHVRAAGLTPWSRRPDLGPRRAREHSACWDHWRMRPENRFLARPDLVDLHGRFEDLMAATRGADLFLFTTTEFLGITAAEKTGLPSLALAVSPMGVSKPPEGSRPEQIERCLTATDGNGVRYVDVDELVGDLRQGLGLPRRQGAFKVDTVAGISRHYCAPHPDLAADIAFTGFWIHEPPAWRDWRPDRETGRFIESGEPPLVLTFSSLPVRDAATVVRVHARAAALLERKIVMLGGWAGFDGADVPPDCKDRVLVRQEMPHGWLFERAAAVIHHGGIGTVARAATHGLPMLVEPYGNDQFFNAWRVVTLGIGAAAHPHLLMADAAARILEKKVLSPEPRRRAAALGHRILEENGLATAADRCEARLAGSRCAGVEQQANCA